MKSYVLLTLVVAITVSCNDETKTEGPGSWTRWNDFPKEGRNVSLTFSVNGKGYWAFGYNPTSGHIKEVWSYDPSTDSWEQKKDFPFGVYPEAVAVANCKAYVLLNSGILYEYDPANDSWKEKAPFPDTEFHGCVAFALGSNVYFGSGNGTTRNDAGYFSTSKSFWKYSVANNAWTKIEDLPGPPRTIARSFVIGDNAYVGIGYDAIGAPPFHTDFYRYDGKTWHSIADLPEAKTHMQALLSSAKTKVILLYPLKEIRRMQLFLNTTRRKIRGAQCQIFPAARRWRPGHSL